MNPPKHTLPLIIFSQFCCTSLWFAGNGVMGDLVNNFQLSSSTIGHLTAAVQFGFIIGTIVFAVFTIADRYSPSKVFFVSAIIGALFNLGTIYEGNNLSTLLLFRFFSGFFLAGIYPVGMKIAADYYEKGLGKSLGFLVGALVLGTAFPHLLKGFSSSLPWKSVLLTTSSLAIVGGTVILAWVPNGPFRKSSLKVDFSAFFKVFKNQNFRAAAFGYFGHMWELYAFWAFVPIILESYQHVHPNAHFNIPLLSFSIIAVGSLACAAGGLLSEKMGVKKVASTALLLSGICCASSPFFFALNSETTFLSFLFLWGMVVIADSPLFSTLVAQNAPAEGKGTALTIVNSIGFAITIISIQLLNMLKEYMDTSLIFTLLAIGPILGLLALYQKRTKTI